MWIVQPERSVRRITQPDGRSTPEKDCTSDDKPFTPFGFVDILVHA